METYSQIQRKQVKDQTFILDYGKGHAYNANWTKVKCKSRFDEDYSVLSNNVLANTVKKVLGKERLKQLSAYRLRCLFQCTPDGKIEQVYFSFPGKIIFLSVEEIAALEKALRSQQFPIKLYNKNIKNIVFAQGYSLGKLVE